MPILCSHCDLLIGPSRKKSLIPKLSGKCCAASLEIPYQWFLRHLLVRLSELPRQHRRATRSWQIIQPPSHGNCGWGWLSALNLVFQ